MELTAEERDVILEHRRNAEAFRRLAREIARDVFDHEYELAMAGARDAIGGIATSVGKGGR